MAQSGKIFVRHKSLGYVSDDVPLVTRYIKRRKENLIVTSVGRAFHTYGCSHFALLSVSGQHPDDIISLAADTYLIYTSAGCQVFAWRRGSELKHEYVGHKFPVHCILPFGPNLITVDKESNLMVWDIKSEDNFLTWEFQNDKFQITTMMHPSTYINKILLGSSQGYLNLINIKTQSIIYTFKGWDSCVTLIDQSPALDVVGIGLANGEIILHNLKLDETLMKFHQEWGAIQSLSFRTDAPIMASGAGNGRIVLWDLEKGKVFSQLTNAHTAAVTGLQCLPQEPLMVSSSPDNSLKLWIFDKSDGGARLLRVREGHSAPPNYIRFHGANGHNLLSTGGDSCLRIFNTQTETFNKSLGRASYNRKASKRKGKILDDPLIMPPIVKFTSETTRDKEWDSIAAAHLGIPHVTTWSYGKLKMGDIRLTPDRFVEKKGQTWICASPASLVLTHCGNFVVIGYSSGHCDRYNIQSGIHRASYGDPAHNSSVRGVACDSLNQTVITGGGDSVIKWWHFSKCQLITKLCVESGVSFIIQHTESDLLAVALEDCSIALIDTTERTLIRQFSGHSLCLTDAAFSPDARWIITAGMDCQICTWDVPSGCIVDRFKVESACTSLSFSPTGEILATTHVDCLGVYLWFNRTLYTHVTLRPLSNEEIPMVSLPGGEREEGAGFEDEEPEENLGDSCEQIDDLITLSGLPSSRWLNLLNIDIVRRRNKPKDPPRTPAPAPFFLPTIPSLDIRFDLSAATTTQEEALSSDILSRSPFTRLLKSTLKSGQYDNIINKLKSMGPSAINFEIKDIPGEDDVALQQFLEMIRSMLTSGKDFELAQAYLGLFLKVHGGALVRKDTLRVIFKSLLKEQNLAWQSLEYKLFYNLAVVQAIKSA